MTLKSNGLETLFYHDFNPTVKKRLIERPIWTYNYSWLWVVCENTRMTQPRPHDQKRRGGTKQNNPLHPQRISSLAGRGYGCIPFRAKFPFSRKPNSQLTSGPTNKNSKRNSTEGRYFP